MRLLACFLITLSILSNCLAEEKNTEAIFQERLLGWVSAANLVAEEETPENISKLDEAFRGIRSFPREYPNTKYSDDAEFIRYKTTEVLPERWDEFVAKYPEGKLEDFTKEQLGKLKGNLSAFAYECAIPYELMPIYVKGQFAWLADDFKEAEKYLSEFLQKIDLYYADLNKVLPEPYIKLMMTYKSLNKRKEYDKIKQKVFILFPEKRDFIENYWP